MTPKLIMNATNEDEDFYQIHYQIGQAPRPRGAADQPERSQISDFYAGRSVLITGASGFIGKVLIEKLLRTCPLIRRIFVLIRPKWNKKPDERLSELLAAPLFEGLRREGVEMGGDRLVVVEGDVTELNLGLSGQNLLRMSKEVSVIFHSAATVKFDEPLKQSIGINIAGTKNMIEFCRRCPKLAALVHVSTAYANCNRDEIEEHVYPVNNMDPEKLIQMADWLDLDTMQELKRRLLEDRPNTYTYTKALAEWLIVKSARDLPVVICRPSIVVASESEPFKGWIDNVNGPTGVILGCGKGLIRTMLAQSQCVADLVPVDKVINMIITLGWFAHINKNQKHLNDSSSSSSSAVSFTESLLSGGPSSAASTSGGDLESLHDSTSPQSPTATLNEAAAKLLRNNRAKPEAHKLAQPEQQQPKQQQQEKKAIANGSNNNSRKQRTSNSDSSSSMSSPSLSDDDFVHEEHDEQQQQQQQQQQLIRHDLDYHVMQHDHDHHHHQHNHHQNHHHHHHHHQHHHHHLNNHNDDGYGSRSSDGYANSVSSSDNLSSSGGSSSGNNNKRKNRQRNSLAKTTTTTTPTTTTTTTTTITTTDLSDTNNKQEQQQQQHLVESATNNINNNELEHKLKRFRQRTRAKLLESDLPEELADVPVFHCTSGGENSVTWGRIQVLLVTALCLFPSISTYRYPTGSFTNRKSLDNLYRWTLHYIPGYIADFITRLMGGKPKIVRIFNKFDQAASVLRAFTMKQWQFNYQNRLFLMEELLSDEDKRLFSCDMSRIDWEQFAADYVLGVRKFLLKEPMKTLEQARWNLKFVYYRNLSLQVLSFATLTYYLVTSSWWWFPTTTMTTTYSPSFATHLEPSSHAASGTLDSLY